MEKKGHEREVMGITANTLALVRFTWTECDSMTLWERKGNPCVVK